jgi:hypothetical protein
MRLDIGAYGALLAVGLGAAYWASLPAPEGDEEKVSIYAVEPKSISEVTYKSKEVDAVASRREDGRFLVTHTKTEEVKPPPKDPHKPDAPPPPAQPPKVTTEHFVANEKMDELLKAFNPLTATRVIGKVDDKQLEDFGLKAKDEVFTVKADGGKTYTLVLGKRSYGSRNRFAMEEGGSGRVLLVDDTSFENLERAPLRMYDRRLVGFEFDEVAKAHITAGGKEKRLAHTQRDKSGQLLWTDDEENATAKPSYDSFMDKVTKLRLTAYADPTEEAGLKDLKPFLEITFEKNGQPLDHLTFTKTTGDKPVYWITSDFLKTHAKLMNGRVEPLEKDVGAMVTGDAKS